MGKASVKKFFRGKKYEFNEFNMETLPDRLVAMDRLSPIMDKDSRPRRPQRVPRVLQSSHSDSDDVVYVLENRERLFSSHSTRIKSSLSSPATPRNPNTKGSDKTETGDEARLLSKRIRRTRSGTGRSRSRSNYDDTAESCDSGISVSESRSEKLQV